jgi:gas vesicle protein
MGNLSLIIEGGAYGHLHHPFETDLNLTFGQLKTIISDALDGKLEMVTEKTDGLQLSITWKDGKLLAARNKSHLKNNAQNALSIDEITKQFKGRGAIQEAFKYAMMDLSTALKQVSPDSISKIFKNGSRFMMLEVIYPKAINVIPYGQSLIVFHDLKEYDETGNETGSSAKYAISLAKLISNVNQSTQKHFNIQGPPIVELPTNTDLKERKSHYLKMLSTLQKEFKLSDEDGVVQYHAKWWENWIKTYAPSKVPKDVMSKLINRWVYDDRTFRVTDITSDKTLLKWAQKVDSVDRTNISKKNIAKFEKIFLGIGSDILSMMKSVLNVNHSTAVSDIRDRINKTISAINNSDDPAKINKLKIELERLDALGGWDSITPIEGIVFRGPDGNMLKLTGKFAPINQILNLMYKK